MQGLQVELIVSLDRHEAHVLPGDGFGDGLGINEIVLVGLYEWFYKLRRDQPHLMALIVQSGTDEVRSRTGLNADQRAL
jgi:hypothetical protein